MPDTKSLTGRRFLISGLFVVLGFFVLAFWVGDRSIQKEKVAARAQLPNRLTLAVAKNSTADTGADAASGGSLALSNSILLPDSEIVRASNFGEKNTTNQLATSIAQEIIALNPMGPGPKGSQKLNIISPDAVVDRLTARAIKNFDSNEFRPHVSPANFKIVADSKEAFEIYFKGFFGALRNNFVGLDIGNGTSLSEDEANRMLAAYDKAMGNLTALAVPRSLIFIHQQELSLVMGQKRMFQMLAEYSRDPLQAILAINEGENLHKDFEVVGKEITEFIQKNNLTL